MKKPRVLMLLSNAYRPDPRVRREASALTQAGYQVTIFCWDRLAELPEHEVDQGIDVRRYQGARTTYGLGAKQVLRIPQFWQAAQRFALAARPDIIHCHDLDTLLPGVRAKSKLNCRLIYDAHEHYPALMSLYLPGIWVKSLAGFERMLSRRVDTVITASSILADEWRSSGLEAIDTIGNYASLQAFDEISAEDVAREKGELGIQPHDLVVVYIGGFSKNREILPLIEAGREISGVSIHLWGDGHQRDQVEASVSNATNISYHGWLPAARVPLFTMLADVIYYCLRQDYPGAVYNAPNTLANAMAAGKPILANDVGDLGRIVKKTGCGRLLIDVSPKTIQEALEALREPDLRYRLGKAGREAAEREYNWEIASRRLISIYDQSRIQG